MASWHHGGPFSFSRSQENEARRKTSDATVSQKLALTVMKIYYHPHFRRAYKSLPLSVKKRAENRVEIFREDPFDSRLRTHKLHGQLSHLWSFYIDSKYRIIFEFDEKDAIFLDTGDHDIYR